MHEDIHPDIVYQGNTTGIGPLLKESMGISIQDKAIAEMQIDEHLVIRKIPAMFPHSITTGLYEESRPDHDLQ